MPSINSEDILEHKRASLTKLIDALEIMWDDYRDWCIAVGQGTSSKDFYSSPQTANHWLTGVLLGTCVMNGDVDDALVYVNGLSEELESTDHTKAAAARQALTEIASHLEQINKRRATQYAKERAEEANTF